MHYWASPIEARLCSGQEVALVGAGNSAGQAAVYLASQVRKVSAAGARRQSRRHHVALSGRAHQGAAEHRNTGRDRGRGAGRPRGQSRRGALAQSRNRRGNDAPHPPSLPVHRRRPEHRLAGAMQRRAGRQGLRAHRAGPCTGAWPDGNEPQRGVRHRRRALGLGQARGCRRRRRRPGGGGIARLSRANGGDAVAPQSGPGES